MLGLLYCHTHGSRLLQGQAGWGTDECRAEALPTAATMQLLLVLSLWADLIPHMTQHAIWAVVTKPQRQTLADVHPNRCQPLSMPDLAQACLLL